MAADHDHRDGGQPVQAGPRMCGAMAIRNDPHVTPLVDEDMELMHRAAPASNKIVVNARKNRAADLTLSAELAHSRAGGAPP